MKNMGTVDRALRLIVVAAIAYLWWTGALSGTWAIVLGVLAAVFFLTSLIGTCPLYIPLGLSTCKKR